MKRASWSLILKVRLLIVSPFHKALDVLLQKSFLDKHRKTTKQITSDLVFGKRKS